jgi:hypothetical protein
VETSSTATAGTGQNVQFSMAMPQKEEHDRDKDRGGSPAIGGYLSSGDAMSISTAGTYVGYQGNTIGCGCETKPVCCPKDRDNREGQSQSGMTFGVNLVAARTTSTADAYTGRNLQTNMWAAGYLYSGDARADSLARTEIGAQVNGLN